MAKDLRYGSDEPFWMNYQQIKVDMAVEPSKLSETVLKKGKER